MTVAIPQGRAARLTPTATREEGRFPPGTILCQRYRVSARLGKGGMGEVYRATDLLLGQPVALKFLPESLSGSQAAIERLRNEVRVARQISHPNVCRVYDIGEANGQTFLNMEFIDGEDLASLLRRIGRLPPVKALEIARRLCAGLAAAHEKGVLHRDLKPGNVMIDGRGQVVITDFGLASIATEVAYSDIRSGTPAYMSPEQLAGVEVSQRSDIYALGLLLFELFAGVPPHPSLDREELRKLREGRPPSLVDLAPEVDPALDRVVGRCLEPSPGGRPESALAVAAALPGGDPLAAALAMGETPSPDLVASAEPAERMQPRIAAACLAALWIAMLANAWISGRTSMLAPFAADIQPAAMAQTARDILTRLGYSPRSAWSDWSLEFDYAAIPTITRLDRSSLRARVAQDPPVYFWYRAGPDPMISSNPFQPFATYDNPPPGEPGMIRLRLNRDRHLQALAAIPLALDTANEQAPRFDWKGLFDTAGLDPSHFEPATPIWTPPSAFDARAAWREVGAEDPLRVEAAAWRGRPVFFRSVRNSLAVQGPPKPSGAGYTVYVVTLLTLISVLGWHNLRRGRCDLRGATRFALFIGAAAYVRILLMAPHAAGYRGFQIFVAITGNMLWAAATSGLGYLALEPLVRRRWPRALIAWTRLLDGKVLDPVVSQHLLLGLLCGAAVSLSILVLTLLEFGGPPLGWAYLLSPTVSRAVQGILSYLISAASETLWLFCLLFVAVTVCRNKWLGACITGTILALGFGWGSNATILEWVITPLLAVGLMLFAIRYGLFALVAAMFVVGLRNFPLTLDTSAFYFSTSLAALATILGLGTYAYRNAVAGRRLFS
jgi:serine/threonine-protein kinase